MSGERDEMGEELHQGYLLGDDLWETEFGIQPLLAKYKLMKLKKFAFPCWKTRHSVLFMLQNRKTHCLQVSCSKV